MAKYFVANHLTGTLAATDVTATGVLAQVRPTPISDAVSRLSVQFNSLTIASGTNLVANDVIELGVIPVDHVLVDFILATASWDSNASPLLAGSIGLMAGAVGDTSRVYTDVGTEGGSALVWGKTAVSDYIRCTAPLFARIAVSKTAVRSIGMAVTHAAVTDVAATRRIDFTLFTRPTYYGA